MALYKGNKLLAASVAGLSAYEQAVAGGYTGTEEEFNILLANLEDSLNNKAPLEHTHTPEQAGADPAGSAAAALVNANTYTDEKISQIPTPDVSGQIGTHNDDPNAHTTLRQVIDIDLAAAEQRAKKYTDDQIALIPTPDVSGQIGTHNTDTAAHNDIRTLISELSTRLSTLANSDDETLDQMAEVVAYIKSNKTLIDAITTSKVSVSDIVNDLVSDVADKPLSAAQGVALKALIDGASSVQIVKWEADD